MNVETNNKKRGLGRGLGSLLGGGEPATETKPINKDEPKPTAAAKPAAPPTTTASSTVSSTGSAKPAPAAAAPSQASAPTQTAPAAPVAQAVAPESRVWQVGIDKLKPGVFQPRTTFEKEPLEELAQSIRQNGILQPIIVRKTADGRFEIVAGERRWRAAQSAGLHEVPVLIKNFNDKEALELAIVENIQREDLNPIEEAEAYSRLMAEFSLSQQQVAERVGKERATVANATRLLGLPTELKKMVASQELSVGHAKVLLSLPDPKQQILMAARILKEKLTVRKLEKEVADELKPKAAPTVELAQKTMNQLISALAEDLQRHLSTKVGIDYQNGKGRIHLSFYSDEELNRLVDQMKGQ